jgi:branched-chain amino acid transport system substrate-binding protein
VTFEFELLEGVVMKKMRLSYLCAGVLATMCFAQPAVADVKIGFVTTLSGPSGALGQDQYDGFMLAVEKNGGKLGGQVVTVLKEDDQLKPDVGVQIVGKFIEKDKVDLIAGLTFSNVMMAVSKPVIDANMLLVSTNAGPSDLAGKGCHANLFFPGYQNDVQAQVLASYAMKKGYKNIYLMAPNYQSGRDQVAGFKRTLTSGKIAGEAFTQLGQPDYSAELMQVQAAAPDAVFAFFPGGMGVNFIKQYRQAGLMGKLPLLTASTVDGINLPALKDAALGTIAGAAWGPDFDNPVNREFVAAFQAKYKRMPSQYAAQAYDAALLIGSALQSAGSGKDRDALRAGLKKADYVGVRGKKIAFANNNFPIQDLHIFEVAANNAGQISLKTIDTPMKNFKDDYAVQCPLK